MALNALLASMLEGALPPATPLYVYLFNKYSRCKRESTLGAYEPLTMAEYEVEGETALYDALSAAIEEHVAAGTAATFVILSDGRDTASEHSDKSNVQRQVEEARTQLGCEFIFVGEGLDAEETGHSIGVREKDMFLTRDQQQHVGAVLNSQELSTALSQSMSLDQVPPFIPPKGGGRAKKAKVAAVVEFPDSQQADL